MLDRADIESYLESSYREKFGVPNDQKVDRRLFRFRVDQSLMRMKILAVYRESPKSFHRANGKLVSEWLRRELERQIDRDPRANIIFPSHGEKFIQETIRKLKRENRIPNELKLV